MTDTDPLVARMLVEGYRKMSPAQRLSLAGQMCEAVFNLVVAGLRARHPGASEEDLKRHIAEIYLGQELAKAAIAVSRR